MESVDSQQLSPRQTVEYICQSNHTTTMIFSTEIELPLEWDCKHCSKVGKLKNAEQPEPVETKPVRTHLDILHARRTKPELEQILKEAIADLRQRRKKAS